MADPTLTHSNTGTNNVASATATFGFTATAGRLLVFLVGSDDYKTGDPSGWTLLDPGGAQQNYLGTYFWWKISSGSESSVVYTIGSAVYSAWAVLEFDNIDNAAPLDIANGQNAIGSTDTYATPSVVASTGRRLAVAAIGGNSDLAQATVGVESWTNGYTEVADQVTAPPSGSVDMIAAATLVFDGNGSTGTSTMATRDSAGYGWLAAAGIIGVFKVSSAAPVAWDYHIIQG